LLISSIVLRRMLLISLVTIGAADLAACNPCGSSESPQQAYKYDERISGDLVVPPSWNYPATVDPNNGLSGCGPSSNDICMRDGPDAPGCGPICIEFIAKDESLNRRLTLIVHILMSPPPTTSFTLPRPDVFAAFSVTESVGSLYETYPVTVGSVTPRLQKGSFVLDVEANAATSDGQAIALRNGRYALVNGRYEMYCQGN